MTISGFTSALASVSGKAYGAKDYACQWKSFLAGLKIALVVGLTTTFVFLAFPEQLFSLFLNDEESLRLGKDYLVILAYSQLFMCIELLSTGAFYGWGKTYLPAIISIILTSARIPLAYILTTCCSPALNTVWWSISLSSIAKGILLTGLFFLLFQSFLKTPAVTHGK
jgi:Na+-driven multidrug efflux pump